MQTSLRFIHVFLLLFLGLSQIKAQVVPFPEDPAAMLKQLEATMNSTGRKDMKDAYELFEKSNKNSNFTPLEFKQIVATLNRFQTERLSVNPFFGLYLQSTCYANKNQGTALNTFASWHNMLDELFKIKAETKSNEQLRSFLEFSVTFLKDRTLRDSEGGMEWKATSDRYTMKIEDKKPTITWDATDIKLIRGKDSILIYNTSGTYYPLQFSFIGKNGQVRWGDRIVEMKDVTAQLNNFNLDTRRGLYRTDSVTLTYPLLLGTEKILGSLEDKLLFGNDGADGSYPRFESYQKELSLQNLGKGVSCVGGLRLNGVTIYAVGEKGAPARISISDNNIQRFKALSPLFSIKREELVVSEQSNIALYFGKDSIWHPAVHFRYNIKSHELELKRGDRGSELNPFFDSYHQFSIAADRINWYLDKDSLYIGKRLRGAGDFDKSATFESSLFFQLNDYMRMQNIADYNPVATLKLACEKKGTRFLSANEIAKLMDAKLDGGMVQPLLFDLAAKGFIRYEPETQMIEVLDKVFHYADASQKRVDYDVIRIYSESDKFDNAVFNLRDTGMVINAVESFELSKKQQVALKPDAQFVTIRKDRDVDFDGRLFAGYTTYMGKQFHFDYEKFMIGLDSIRFMDIYLPTGKVDKKNKPELHSLKSRIEYLTAVLQIDAPNNKSGREELPFFPSIQTKDVSYVFYDYKETRNKVYTRDSFFFKLDKFFLNSLDSLLEKDVRFKGNFYSADIFPVFKEELEVMPDTSLGFLNKTPDIGLPTYRKQGNYKGNLNLSNLGLLGDGVLTYLGSTCVSDSFIYMPKQMFAAAKKWENVENRSGPTKFPQAIGVGVDVDWLPYRDSMYVYSKAKPFDLFKANDHKLTGSLILTPKALNGRGTLDWSKAVMNSPQFSFDPFAVNADTTSLGIKTGKGDAIAVSMDNINGNANFDNEKAHFRANDLFGQARMPSIQYITSMNEFDWDIKNDKVNFLSDPNSMAGFRSVHPEQDSLYFAGKTALYDINANQLNVGGVEYIQTCDAYIYTTDGKVTIKEGAVMSTLNDARIVCDTVNKHHIINRVTADIKGKKLYTAKGYYAYDIGVRKQEILFEDIVGQRIGKGNQDTKATETRATGTISDSTLFYMDHKTMFKGKIALSASDVNLDFDGFAEFDVSTLPGRQQFSVHSKGDKNNLNIAFDVPQNPKGDPLRTGFYVSAESNVLYPRTMQALYFRKDRPIMPARGVFRYDQKADEFVFGDSSRLILNGKRGTRVAFQVGKSRMVGDGPLLIGSGLKNCKMTSSGRITVDYLSEDAYVAALDTTTGVLQLPPHINSVQAMSGIVFNNVPENLLRIMAADIQVNTFDAPDIAYAGDYAFFENALAELFTDPKEYLNIVTELKNSTLRINEKANPYHFLFSQNKMIWDQENASFVSDGTRLGLNSIIGQTINKQVLGYMEVRMPKDEDDRVYIYLKTASDVFYFFGYNQGVLSMTSNNDKFNQALLSIKEKDRIKKLADGSTYEIQYVEPSTASAFVSRVQAAQSRK